MSDLQLTFNKEALWEGVNYESLPLESQTREILLNGARFQGGDKLDPSFVQIFDQLRPLGYEANVHIVQNPQGEILYQQTPDIGTEHYVDTWHSTWAEEKRGLHRLMKIHNHPSPTYYNGLFLASNFFSPRDWLVFLSQDTLRVSAVVWDEGTAMLLKGPFSHKKIKSSFMMALLRTEFQGGPSRFLNFLVKSRRWPEGKKRYFAEIAWLEYWTVKWQQANADYDSGARLRINRMLAEQLGVQLVFIPKDSRDVQVLVDV